MSKTIYLFSISSHSNAININPLSIEFFKPKVDFSEYDYFIITSKQIAKILNFYEINTKNLKPALCISKQSAKSYKAINGEVLEVGSGYGEKLTHQIQKYAKETKWLYLRAEVVASNFAELCRADGYNIDEEIIYKSTCSDSLSEINLKEESVLIFTSPSSVKCFLKQQKFHLMQKIVVIGKTTAKQIPKNIECIVSPESNIESCMEIAQTL